MKSILKESISQALEGIPVSITCNATDYPSEAELIDDDGVIVCSNCWASFFSSLDDDETNEETKREFLFVHDVRGNINEQNRKYWIVSWENWDAYAGFTYPSKSFYNEEDADKFVETLKKNENNREILKYASTGIPSVPPIYKEEKELKKYDLIKKIRKPLPPQKHSIHKDKTKYDRKRDKKIDLNENIKWNIGDVVELDGYCRSKSMYYYELPYTGLLRVIKIDDRGGHTLKNIETGEVCQTIFMGDCLIKPSVYMESKNIVDEARQYAHDGFDVELECLKKNDFGYLVSSTDMNASMKNPEGPWRSKYICSVCGMDSDWTHFMDFHKFFGGLTLNESIKELNEVRDLVYSHDFLRSGKIEDIYVSCKTYRKSYGSTEAYMFFDANCVARCSRCRMDIDDPDFSIYHNFNRGITLKEIVRKVGNEYVLYSKKKDPKTGKRRVLGRSKTKEGIEKREKQVQYFKNKEGFERKTKNLIKEVGNPEWSLLQRLARQARNEFSQSLVLKGEDEEEFELDPTSRKTLATFCHLASKRLFDLSKEKEIPVSFCNGIWTPTGDDHCWITYNNFIIDITATQFGEDDEVYITTTRDHKYKTIKCEKNYFHPEGWEDEEYRINKNNRICIKGNDCFRTLRQGRQGYQRILERKCDRRLIIKERRNK
jgi:hypothetical protein